jgi:hypothetical protein
MVSTGTGTQYHDVDDAHDTALLETEFVLGAFDG